MSIKNLTTQNLKFDQQLKINSCECIDLSVNNLEVDELIVNDLSVNNINANDISTNRLYLTPSIYTDLVITLYERNNLTVQWFLADGFSAVFINGIRFVKIGSVVNCTILNISITAPTSSVNVIESDIDIPEDYRPANNTIFSNIICEENVNLVKAYMAYEPSVNNKFRIFKADNSNWAQQQNTIDTNSFIYLTA